jgi:hypothetical protein
VIVFLVLSSFVVMNLVIAVMCRSLYLLQQIEKQRYLTSPSSSTNDEEGSMPVASPSNVVKRREEFEQNINSIVQQMERLAKTQIIMQHKLNLLVTEAVTLNKDLMSDMSSTTLQSSNSKASYALCGTDEDEERVKDKATDSDLG